MGKRRTPFTTGDLTNRPGPSGISATTKSRSAEARVTQANGCRGQGGTMMIRVDQSPGGVIEALSEGGSIDGTGMISAPEASRRAMARCEALRGHRAYPPA
jgi:hypothetical protein